MLSKPPACYRAVQRQLLRPSDSVWISDSVLHHALQRFAAASRTGKRYGSFVPGPLESRRRLGKRRMAHLSESILTSAHNIGGLWGSFGEVDRTKWQWESPTKRPERQNSTPVLPAWLLYWDSPSQVVPESLHFEELTDTRIEEPLPVERQIINFRRNLRAANSNAISEICNEFNQHYKQNLMLGLVSEETIYDALKTLSREIRIAFSKSGLAWAQPLLSFYRAFWDGLIACKVLQPANLDPRILERFLFRLERLPICPEVQSLFHGVVLAATVSQLGKMSTGIRNLVKAWVETWLHEQQVSRPEFCFAATEQALLRSATAVFQLHDLMTDRGAHLDVKPDLAMIERAFRAAESSISYSIEAIVEAEKVITPIKRSVDALSSALSYLPQRLLHSLLHSCTHQVISIRNSMETPNADLHYGWLSLVAKLPGADDRIFVDTLKQMKDYEGTPNHLVPGDILLSHWASQGDLVQEPLIRNTFEISVLDGGPLELGFVRLLLAIDKHRGGFFSRTRALFNLLGKIGKYEDIYRILLQMRDHGMRLPADVISPAIEIMSKYDLNLAHYVFKLYFYIRFNEKALQPHHTPNFIISMIQDPHFHPRAIWGVMRIPFYEDLDKCEGSKFSAKPLSPAMLRLLTKMAIAFAHSDARPQRVAFRNVVQCLHHLRRHNAPVTPELTRAISHAGFTRKIFAGKWVSKELLSWALGLIEWAEGGESAIITEKAVGYWNEKLEGKQHRETRETNVLRVGPID